LETTAFKPKLARVLQDELAVACVMGVEPKARLVREQRLQKRLALDELKIRDVPTVQMQEIEGIIDELHASLAIGGGLGIGKAWQASFVDAAELTVEIGGLDIQVRERRGGARILLVQSRPVLVRSCTRSRRAWFHAAIEAPTGAFRPAAKAGGEMNPGRGTPRGGGPDLPACEAERLTTLDMLVLNSGGTAAP
jgi:hypothetical protein